MEIKSTGYIIHKLLLNRGGH